MHQLDLSLRIRTAIVVTGDRFFPITKKQQPMFNLKISVSAYTAGTWRNLEKSGEIEVSAEVDTLSEGYEKLKTQIN